VTEIRSVPAQAFPAVYPKIEGYLQRLVEREHGGLTLEYMATEIITGAAQLLVVVQDGEIIGCAITTIAPDGTVTVAYCAGDDVDSWHSALMDAVERESPNVEVIGRPGWWRKSLKARGYRITGYVMERRAGHV